MNDNESIMSVTSEDGRGIRWYDDGWGKLWHYRDAEGLRAIIRASSEANAYEIVLDDILAPIPTDEVLDAYGFSAILESPWGMLPEVYGVELPSGEVVGEYATRGEAMLAAQAAYDAAVADGDGVYLMEGYQYQSNASGSGIVQICLGGELLEETTVQELEDTYAIHVEVETDDE